MPPASTSPPTSPTSAAHGSEASRPPDYWDPEDRAAYPYGVIYEGEPGFEELCEDEPDDDEDDEDPRAGLSYTNGNAVRRAEDGDDGWAG